MAAQLAPLVEAARASAAEIMRSSSPDTSEAAVLLRRSQHNNGAESDTGDNTNETGDHLLAHESPVVRTCSTNKRGEYVCQVCDKAFKGRIGLRRHMHLHTGQSPYQCDRCSASFGYIGNLKRHMRIHTGEKPFSCKFCGRAFSDDSHRRSHEKIHLQDGGKYVRGGPAPTSDECDMHNPNTTTTAAAVTTAASVSRPRNVRAVAARRRRVPVREGSSSDSDEPELSITDEDENDPSFQREATVPIRASAGKAFAVSRNTPETRTRAHGAASVSPAHSPTDPQTDGLPVSSTTSPVPASGRPEREAQVAGPLSLQESAKRQNQHLYPSADQPLAPQPQSLQSHHQNFALPHPHGTFIQSGPMPHMFLAPSMPCPSPATAAAAAAAAPAAAGTPPNAADQALLYQRIMHAHMQSFAIMAAQYGLVPAPMPGMQPPMSVAPTAMTPAQTPQQGPAPAGVATMQMMAPMPLSYYPHGYPAMPAQASWMQAAPQAQQATRSDMAAR